jgi:ketosteroid isomerase-like protein
MSKENVEIIARLTALINSGKLDQVSSLWDAGIVFRDLRSAVDSPQELAGAEAVRRLWADWGDAWDVFGLEVFECVDVDPYVICDARWFGTGRESNIPIDVRQADTYEFRDGKIIRVTLGYGSKADALEAVGRAA